MSSITYSEEWFDASSFARQQVEAYGFTRQAASAMWLVVLHHRDATTSLPCRRRPSQTSSEEEILVTTEEDDNGERLRVIHCPHHTPFAGGIAAHMRPRTPLPPQLSAAEDDRARSRRRR